MRSWNKFRRVLTVIGIAGAVLAFPIAASARGQQGKHEGHGNKRDKLAFFDSRQTPAAQVKLHGREARLASSPNGAADNLHDSLGSEGIVAIDPLTSTPRMVGRLDDFLTGPSSASPSSIALGYVSQNAGVFGLSQGSMAGFELVRDYVDIDGTHHLFYVQKVNGVPVFGNGLKANVTADGRLINVLGSPVATAGASTASPTVSAAAAIANARQDGEESMVPFRLLPGATEHQAVFSNGDRASMVVFQGVDGLRPAWQTMVSGSGVAFEHVIDAVTGRVLYRRSLVNYADGLVYDNYPGAANGGTQVQKSISLPGWLSSTTTLSGNNAHVYSDLDDSNDPTDFNGETEEIAPSGGGNWLFPVTPFTFNGPLNTIYNCATQLCTWNPSVTGDPANSDPSGDYSYQTNQSETGTQLFYLVNKYHDHLAAFPIGFNEAAGNFQVTNSSGRGLGDDPLLGEDLDGANSYGFGFPDPNHTNNANMSTPPDGQSPRMQMYLWHDPTTDYFGGPSADPFVPADGANEADIVYHEYTHGLSNRLVVDSLGNSTLGNIQAGSMGEAWSDWYAFDYLVASGLIPDTSASGELRVGQYLENGADLIRTEPLDCAVGSSAPLCPGTPDVGHAGGYTYGDFGHIIGRPEVHADGEIWGQTLWDLRTALGSAKAERLVTRAMELSPANPSYLDMRNAILLADLVRGGRDRNTIWSVFAHRGMGYFAAATDGDDAQPVEDFSLPPGRHAEKGDLRGRVTDADTNLPISGAVVAFGGHDSGFPGDFADVADRNGRYKIRRIFVGTYPKVNATAPGYDMSVDSIVITRFRSVQKNWALKRDWASLAGGGSVTGFNGPDFTDFGCGPSAAIDQSQGNGWGSTTDDDAGDATGLVTPKYVVVKLPVAVTVSGIAVNPASTCGDPGSSSTRGYRVEVSTDGTSFSPVAAGVFYLANRGTLNTVFSGQLAGIRYVKFWMLNPQVPTAADPTSSCTGAADCGTNPDDNSGVATHCGDGKDNAFGGCQFMDMSELEIYGKPS